MQGIFHKFEKLSIVEREKAVVKVAEPFKFNFALSGEGDAGSSSQLKKKRKKKKKAKKAGVVDVQDGDSSSDEDNAPETQVVGSEQRPEAVGMIPAQDDSTSQEHLSTVDESVGVGKASSKSKRKKKKAPAAGPIDVTQPDPTASRDREQKTKKSAKGSQIESKSADDLLLEEAIALAAQEKKDIRAKRKADEAKGILPTGKMSSKTGKMSSKKRVDKSVPHFMSPNDPELDPKLRLQAKYGKGKNLVAIGPPKVRDPHWLQAPPGLSAPKAAVDVVAHPPAAPALPPGKEQPEDLHSSPFSFSFSFQS